jgi:hypothetical protein
LYIFFIIKPTKKKRKERSVACWGFFLHGFLFGLQLLLSPEKLLDIRSFGKENISDLGEGSVEAKVESSVEGVVAQNTILEGGQDNSTTALNLLTGNRKLGVLSRDEGLVLLGSLGKDGLDKVSILCAALDGDDILINLQQTLRGDEFYKVVK